MHRLLGDGDGTRHGRLVVDVGVDWGFASDASTMVAFGRVPSEQPFSGDGVYWVPFLLERFATPYEQFIDEVVALGGHSRGLKFNRLTPEQNGVGQMPSHVLTERLVRSGVVGDGMCEGVHMEARLKESAFGWLKLLLQSKRLALPRHPGLLRQLSALEFEFTEAGSMRIQVPERAGHDDICMGLVLATVPAMREAMKPAPVFMQVRSTRAGILNGSR